MAEVMSVFVVRGLKITDVQVEGIDPRDYPDFCDAYIQDASVWCDKINDWRDASFQELDDINEDRDFVYEQAWDLIF